MADDKKFIQKAIKRPGALTRRSKREGRSVIAQAQKDVSSGTTLEKRQGNFFLKVLKPLAQKARKRRSLIT